MSETIILADLHLREDAPHITQHLLALEARLLKADALYILGDFVEVWVGDDAPIPTHIQPAFDLLKRLSDAGVPLFFQHGNRDFMIGSALATRLGFSLLPDVYVTELYGHRVALLHGDTLCTDDLPYQAMRRKLRHPVVRFVLRHLPLKTRLNLATQLRERSKQATGQKTDGIMDVNNHAVSQTMQQQGVNVLIHGHTHRPAIHQETHGLRAVLGDWEKGAVLLSVQSTGLSLERIHAHDPQQLAYEPWPKEG
ncbi:MAG: UDP-2,3-diacylglucosamine diphosphatase [Gammaproteobacteria bacterium 28-57-27]|nr:MAG: UDP-2,3-diacylglucosamine diphosphatase [Gammaproteobacteria bacterium 28-57-27]